MAEMIGKGPMILVLDLEATCADDDSISSEAMEIIEVGACWAMEDGRVVDQFQSFVRPIERPNLTPFCMGLTHIEQFQIDRASCWPEVVPKLAEFVRRHEQTGVTWGSWGAYDARQIQRDCARHGTSNPLDGLAHRNLKAEFARRRKIKQVGMATAMRIVGLRQEGVQHRALDDALNISRLLPWSAFKQRDASS